MRRTRWAFVVLSVFVACLGALSLSGCSGSDDGARATAVAREAGAALKESISIETTAARLVLSIQMVPELGLGRPGTRKLGLAGLKTLDESDRLRQDARKRLDTARQLYASIDGMTTSDGVKQWVGMAVLFANKWGEAISHDEADSALRRKALNMLADDTVETKRTEFGALIDEIYEFSKSKQTLMTEVNRLAAEADGFARSLK